MPGRYPYNIDLVEATQIAVTRGADDGLLVPGLLRVDVPLLRKPVEHLDQLPCQVREEQRHAAIDEAKRLAYEKFVLSLQIVAEHEPFFPFDSLRRFNESRYVILIPTEHWRRLRLQVSLPGRGSSLFARHGRFEFEILAHPRLLENEGYLIGGGKYQLYLHVRERPDEICVYRSEFVDRNTGGPPPIGLEVRHLLAELLDQRPPTAPRYAPYEGDSESAQTGQLDKCPDCAGRLHYLTLNKAFCLDCEWDNLEVLNAT